MVPGINPTSDNRLPALWLHPLRVLWGGSQEGFWGLLRFQALAADVPGAWGRVRACPGSVVSSDCIPNPFRKAFAFIYFLKSGVG